MAILIWAGRGLSDSGIEADSAVIVEEGRVRAVGGRAQLAAQFPDADSFGSGDYLLLPGFVNAHDHGRAFGTAALGIDDDILEGWLPMLGALPGLPPDLAAQWEAVQLLKSGVTATAHSHNPQRWETLFDEAHDTLLGYRRMGVRVAFHPPLVDQNLLVYADEAAFIAGLPPEMQADARARTQPPPYTIDEYLSACTQLYDRYHDADGHTIHIQISPAGGQWCSDALIEAAVGWARARQTRVQMHLLETRSQRLYAYRTWDTSFIQHLEAIGALGDWLTLAHMVWVDEDDLPLLAARRVGIAHNPSSNLRLHSGIAPLHAFLRAGIAVGVGLDGHALDDDQDYWRELRLAWTLAHYRAGADADLTVRAADLLLTCARHSAAITFGAAPLPAGGFRVGDLADLVLIDWAALCGGWTPDGYPSPDEGPSFLLRHASRDQVRHVMIGGEWRLRDGQAVGIDERALAAEIRAVLAAQDWDTLRARRAAAAQLSAHIRRFYAAWGG